MQLTGFEREYLVKERQEMLRHDAMECARAARDGGVPGSSLRERVAMALFAVALRLSPDVVDIRRKVLPIPAKSGGLA